METLPENSIGQRLRNRRERQGCSLEQAAEQTRIRKVYLEALENDRYEDLPGLTYVTGFLKNYSQFLDLDGDALVTELVEQGHTREIKTSPLRMGEEAARFTAKSGRGGKVFLLGLILVLLLGVGVGIAYYFGLPPFNARPPAAVLVPQQSPPVAEEQKMPVPTEPAVPPPAEEKSGGSVSPPGPAEQTMDAAPPETGEQATPIKPPGE